MVKAALIIAASATLWSSSSGAGVLSLGPGVDAEVQLQNVVPAQYYGPGSGTGTGRDGPGYYGPGSGTGIGRCRPVRVRVCRGGFGDGRGPRCYFERRMRC